MEGLRLRVEVCRVEARLEGFGLHQGFRMVFTGLRLLTFHVLGCTRIAQAPYSTALISPEYRVLGYSRWQLGGLDVVRPSWLFYRVFFRLRDEVLYLRGLFLVRRLSTV